MAGHAGKPEVVRDATSPTYSRVLAMTAIKGKGFLLAVASARDRAEPLHVIDEKDIIKAIDAAVSVGVTIQVWPWDKATFEIIDQIGDIDAVDSAGKIGITGQQLKLRVYI
jgi:hypothetical protein